MPIEEFSSVGIIFLHFFKNTPPINVSNLRIPKEVLWNDEDAKRYDYKNAEGNETVFGNCQGSGTVGKHN